jgi:perosamine synthetase
MKNHRIAIAEPDLSELEEANVVEAVRSTWISSNGEFLRRFEREFAAACGCQHALAVSNGTTAIHLALATLNVGPGDEVIVPSMTYIATANAVRYCGAEPVFVDVDPLTWCIDPARIEDAITPRTKGIIPVHLLGHPADMDPILEIAGMHGLWVVEDAAEATFATYRGRRVGSLGRIATFSFYGNKVLTSGEGGAVTFQDPALEQRMRMLRGQGMDPRQRYYFPIIGFNYRMTNVAAAILCGQMDRRGQILDRRRHVVDQYESRLRGIRGVEVRDDADWATTSPWMFAVLIDAAACGVPRDELARQLDAAGIETRPMFVPIHTLPPYRGNHERRETILPVTDRLGSDGIMLPTHTLLSEADVDYVCDSLVAAVKGRAVAPGLQRRAA